MGMLILCLLYSVSVVTGFLPINHRFRALKLNSVPPEWIQANYPDDDFDHILGIKDESHEPSLLQQITRLRLQEVKLSKAPVDTQGCGFDPTFFVSSEDLEDDIKEFDERYGTNLNLQERIITTQPKMAIAAEFKRTSPSKGDIDLNADAVERCKEYARAGAAVISVATEYLHFKGTLTDMRKIRIATQEQAQRDGTVRPAILQHDFILDKFQILEARANGADSVLLIVAVLGVAQLKELIGFSRAKGMEPLVEVHTEREREIALECGSKVVLVGVNSHSRELHDDGDTTNKLTDVVVVAAVDGCNVTSRCDDDGVSCCLFRL
jgi:anthranilate synthase/indole-3-glycerol phosphate synthase/phosphoribosylanthranilate isomerase